MATEHAEPFRLTHPSLGFVLGLLVGVAGLAVGLAPLSDNSFLTHLATGRLILESGSIPAADPYTFTAQGEPWVVQSWLMSWLYATVEALAGLDGLRVLFGAFTALLSLLVWRLLEPATGVIVRLGLAAIALFVGGGLWSERPLMVGLIGFALVVLAGEGRLDPRWLVPVGWVWVNSHGSFPLGLVYLVVAALGSRLDGTGIAREARCLAWALAGVLAGCIGPLGPKVLLFPLDVLGRRDVLQHVTEWQAPSFDDVGQRAFLLQVMLAVVLLARRPTYRGALVLALFTGAALLSVRNASVASLAMLPAMAGAASGLGSLTSATRLRLGAAFAAVAVVLLAAVVAVRLDEPALDLRTYPVDALAYLASQGVDLEEHRMAVPDDVGNLLELIYGPGERVFYDDRFDMFPKDVSDDYLAVAFSSDRAHRALHDHEVELILWNRSTPVLRVLAGDGSWRPLLIDDDWMVLCARGRPLGGTLGTC